MESNEQIQKFLSSTKIQPQKKQKPKKKPPKP